MGVLARASPACREGLVVVPLLERVACGVERRHRGRGDRVLGRGDRGVDRLGIVVPCAREHRLGIIRVGVRHVTHTVEGRAVAPRRQAPAQAGADAQTCGSPAPGGGAVAVPAAVDPPVVIGAEDVVPIGPVAGDPVPPAGDGTAGADRDAASRAARDRASGTDRDATARPTCDDASGAGRHSAAHPARTAPSGPTAPTLREPPTAVPRGPETAPTLDRPPTAFPPGPTAPPARPASA